eukprot:14223302-Ditylum_brightwellii.AAC.1
MAHKIEDCPLAFYPRKLNPVRHNYTIMKKEILSIMETAKFHCNALLSFELYFRSNNKNLSFENFKSENVYR